MKQPRKVLEAIDEYICDHALLSSNDATDFVRKIADTPDAETLKFRYCRRLFNSRVKKLRDSLGIRSVFSTADKADPIYVNIEISKPDDIDYMVNACRAQTKNVTQGLRNIRKIRNRVIALGGQLSLEDLGLDWGFPD